MAEQAQVKTLLQSARLIFNEIKTNYGEFLTSLKYQNLSDRKKTKQIRFKMDDLPGGAEGWENLMSKQFNFEDELVSQNGGFASFIKLLNNLKKLEEINYQLSLRFFLEQSSSAGKQQIQEVISMFNFLEKGLIASMGVQSREQKKDILSKEQK